MVVRVRLFEQKTGYIDFLNRAEYEEWRNRGAWDLKKAIQETNSFRMELPDGESSVDYSEEHIEWLD